MLKTAVIATAVGLAALTLPPVLAVVAIAGQGHTAPSGTATTDIPAAYLGLYQDAALQRCPGLPWSVLAAIGKVESDHGRLGGATIRVDGSVWPRNIGVPLDGSPGIRRILDTDAGRYDGDTTYDRAVGPMQFLPSTWARYGVDAAGNGIADPHNAIDAIHAAAIYICAHGGDDPERLSDAILAYNRSTTYLDRVLQLASEYAAGSSGVMTAPPTLIAMVLANPRLDIYAAGRDDIAAGLIDARVLTILQLASEHHELQVVSLKSGHSRCIGGGDYQGCHVSHHWHGRAADIAAIDGRPVSSSDTVARGLALWANDLPPSSRPSEIGTPWPHLAPLPGFFSDAAHRSHLHLGWSRTAP